MWLNYSSKPKRIITTTITTTKTLYVSIIYAYIYKSIKNVNMYTCTYINLCIAYTSKDMCIAYTSKDAKIWPNVYTCTGLDT